MTTFKLKIKFEQYINAVNKFDTERTYSNKQEIVRKCQELRDEISYLTNRTKDYVIGGKR